MNDDDGSEGVGLDSIRFEKPIRGRSIMLLPTLSSLNEHILPLDGSFGVTSLNGGAGGLRGGCMAEAADLGVCRLDSLRDSSDEGVDDEQCSKDDIKGGSHGDDIIVEIVENEEEEANAGRSL